MAAGPPGGVGQSATRGGVRVWWVGWVGGVVVSSLVVKGWVYSLSLHGILFYRVRRVEGAREERREEKGGDAEGISILHHTPIGRQ